MRRIRDADAGCDFLSGLGAPQVEFLKQSALLVERSDFGRAYVLPGPDGGPPLLGYYVVCMARLSYEHMPERVRKHAPARTMPVALLAQVARDDRAPKGTGAQLVGEALRLIIRVADDIGCAGAVLDAENQRLREYYEDLGFEVIGSPNAPRPKLFMSLKDLRANVGADAS